MVYTNPAQVPGTFQSRPDSAPNKNYNCGPSSVTHISRFFRDRDFGINATRMLAVAQNARGTLPSERAEMLIKRGVPCKADRIGGSQLITLVRTRPVSVSMLMGKIPYPYRRYSFAGLHELVAVATRSDTNGVAEMAFMDPNYGWPDGETGYAPRYIWMPYKVWYPAFTATGGWAVVPAFPKDIATRRPYVKKCTAKTIVNVRTGPGLTYKRVTSLSQGASFKSTWLETKGGAYVANGKTRTDWLAFNRDGRRVWVARGFIREA